MAETTPAAPNLVIDTVTVRGRGLSADQGQALAAAVGALLGTRGRERNAGRGPIQIRVPRAALSDARALAAAVDAGLNAGATEDAHA